MAIVLRWTDINTLNDWSRFRDACCDACKKNSKNRIAGWDTEAALFNRVLSVLPEDLRLKLFEINIKPKISESSARMKILSDIRNDDNKDFAMHILKQMDDDQIPGQEKTQRLLDLIYQSLHSRKGPSFLVPRWNITHFINNKADWSNYRKEVAEVVRENKTKHVDCWTTEEGRIKQVLTAFPKDVLVLTFNRYSDEYPELAMNAEKILHDLRAGQVQELAAHFAGLGLANRRLIIDRSDHMEATEIFLELVNRFVICEGAFLRPLPPLNTGTSLQDWRKYKEDVIKICSDNKKFGFEEWQTDEGCLNQLLASLPLPVREKVFDLFVKNTASSTEKSEILEDIRKNSFKKLSSFIARLKLTDILGDRSDAESAQFLHWQMQLIFRAAGAVKEWLLPTCTFKMTLEAWNKLKQDAILVYRENRANRVTGSLWEREDEVIGHLIDAFHSRVLCSVPRDVLLNIVDKYVEMKKLQLSLSAGPEKVALLRAVTETERFRAAIQDGAVHLHKRFSSYITVLDVHSKKAILGLREDDDEVPGLESHFNFVLELLHRAQYEWIQLHVRGIGNADDDEKLRSIFQKYALIHAQVGSRPGEIRLVKLMYPLLLYGY